MRHETPAGRRERRKKLDDLRIAGLRIESQRDQLDAAVLDCEQAMASATTEAEAGISLARSKVLAARWDDLQTRVDEVRRQRIQFQMME